ncbi:MAG: hypothetical protein ACI4DY_05280 [Monoglobaceae bacterium]
MQKWKAEYFINNIRCEQIISLKTFDGTINTLKKQYVDHITTVIYVVHYHG